MTFTWYVTDISCSWCHWFGFHCRRDCSPRFCRFLLALARQVIAFPVYFRNCILSSFTDCYIFAIEVTRCRCHSDGVEVAGRSRLAPDGKLWLGLVDHCIGRSWWLLPMKEFAKTLPKSQVNVSSSTLSCKSTASCSQLRA